jgi:hypothetical protein
MAELVLVPVGVLRDVQRCLEGSAERAVWERTADAVERLVLMDAGCPLCRAGHVPVRVCGPVDVARAFGERS